MKDTSKNYILGCVCGGIVGTLLVKNFGIMQIILISVIAVILGIIFWLCSR